VQNDQLHTNPPYLCAKPVLGDKFYKATSESFLVFSDPKEIQKAINAYGIYLKQTWNLIPFPDGEKSEVDSLGRNIGLDKRYGGIVNAMRLDLGMTMSVIDVVNQS
jgi:hypothetical protein